MLHLHSNKPSQVDDMKWHSNFKFKLFKIYSSEDRFNHQPPDSLTALFPIPIVGEILGNLRPLLRRQILQIQGSFLGEILKTSALL